MRPRLTLWCVLVLAAMTAVSLWASLESNIIQGFHRVLSDRWGLATLADAYLGFTWFWLWICFKEKSWLRRGVWLVLLYALGNFAMAAYVLMALARLRPDEGMEALLVKGRS